MLHAMRYLRHLNPTAGINDFWSEFTKPNPHRWPIIAVSFGIPIVAIFTLAGEDQVALPPPPEVIYISTFDPNRTREEIIASNIANQERKEARQKLEEERTKIRQELYRQLGAATGLDTDKMAREIAADEAREKAAEERRRQELLGRAGIDPDAPTTAE